MSPTGLPRRAYRWVLGWADRPGGPKALFWIALMESSFFPVPPDALLIPLGLGKPERAMRFALICAVGSVTGGVLGYAIGYGFMDTLGKAILDFYGGHQTFADIKADFDQYGFWVVFTAGFTPIPYKVFTIAAGAFHINFPVFVAASAVSRSARFFLVSGLIRWKGEAARDFIDKYLNWLIVAFTILLIGSFFLLKGCTGGSP